VSWLPGAHEIGVRLIQSSGLWAFAPGMRPGHIRKNSIPSFSAMRGTQSPRTADASADASDDRSCIERSGSQPSATVAAMRPTQRVLTTPPSARACSSFDPRRGG
jgi:hypothetical protein